MGKALKVAIGLGPLLLVFGAYWLYQRQKESAFAAASPYEKGWMLIAEHGCTACHQADNGFRAPILKGLIGQKVKLADGSEILADAAYVRSSLVEPKLHISAGYQAVMPSFAERLTEEEILAIIAALEEK